VDLSVEEKLKYQRCESTAQESGLRLRAARIEAAVAESEDQANQAWTAMSPQLEQCTRLDPSQRGQCVSALEGWLNEARSISVTIPESVEIVQTGCGEFRPAFEADERNFEARNVPEAEQLLRRLNFSEETAASTVSTGTFNIMFQSHPDSGPEIDTMHVMCQHGGLVKSGPVARIENAGAGPCRIDGFIGTRQLSAVVVIDRPGTYHCFPAGTLACAYAHP
jgi:hypothetical protein